MASPWKQGGCYFFLVCLVLVPASSALEFHVGGERGWHKPTGNETETYNQWATRNRFHIGDTLYFKYKNDSVLVVNRSDYAHCNVTHPVQKFEDGNTAFAFNRYGYFYFISGKLEHCNSGQKLIVRVMVHPEFVNPGPAPAPAPASALVLAPVPAPSSSSHGSSSGGTTPSGAPMPNTSQRTGMHSSFVMATVVAALVVLFFV